MQNIACVENIFVRSFSFNCRHGVYAKYLTISRTRLGRGSICSKTSQRILYRKDLEKADSTNEYYAKVWKELARNFNRMEGTPVHFYRVTSSTS